MAYSPMTDEYRQEIIKQIGKRESIIQKERESESVREDVRERDGESVREGVREGVREREGEGVRERDGKGVRERERENDEDTDKQRMLKALEEVDKENLKKDITSLIIKEKEEKEDKTIDNIDISIKEDEESQVDKLERCSSQQSPPQSQESQPQSQESQPQSQESQHTLDTDNHQDTTRKDPKLDRDCLDILDNLYLNCQENLKTFFDNKKVEINNRLKQQKINTNNFLQIEINTRTTDKFILEINICTQDLTGRNIMIFECAHISLFTKRVVGTPNIRGLHFTLPKYIINDTNKRYSHLYIGHIVAENSLGSADAANKFIRIVLNSMGTYFETQMSI
ncbi:MAG: hypothetical protein ACOVNU_04425, partial [Candidatus Kapaibacteriota bacterium]